MNGVDINRNFPADNHRSRARYGYEPLSEPESTALYDLILSTNPSWIVSIHQPIACVDYDGPASEIAKEISTQSGLPVRKLGSRPGSLGSWAGEDCGIAVITLELPTTASRLNEQELWNTYGPALLSVINK